MSEYNPQKLKEFSNLNSPDIYVKMNIETLTALTNKGVKFTIEFYTDDYKLKYIQKILDNYDTTIKIIS